MFDRNLKRLTVTTVIVVSVFLTLFAAYLVSASDGSISMVNTYPEDGGTYSVLDHITYQTTAVNANTTVSVSIDNGTFMPMSFQGINNEVVKGDSAPRDWYSWQVTNPPIANPGNYTVQFFSHYYVWQDTDKYWAEFNACSSIQSFIIDNPLTASPATTPILASTVPQFQPVPELSTRMILPFIAVATLISILAIRTRIIKQFRIS